MALKILRRQRVDEINVHAPVLEVAKDQKPPAWLGKFGCELWAKLCPVLTDAGLLTVGDIPAFEQLCDEYETIRKYRDDARARDRFRRLLVEFGLTPSARTRIKSTQTGPVDKMAEFLHKAAKKA